jgi:hypothetical protein
MNLPWDETDRKTEMTLPWDESTARRDEPRSGANRSQEDGGELHSAEMNRPSQENRCAPKLNRRL